MQALVLDGQLKSALGAVRALGQRGITVHVGAERGSALALHSKYSSDTFVYSSPTDSQTAFLADIQSYVESCEESLVAYAFSDATFLSLVRNLEQFGDRLLLPHAPLEQIEIAFAKTKTYELADSLGIPTITTYDFDDIDALNYPAVVKTAHSAVWQDDQAVTGTAEFVHSRDELNLRYESLRSATGELPLIQELITGPEFGVELLVKDGEVLQTFAHRRIRSLSPTGGAAVVKETLPESELAVNIRSYAKLLAHELKWTGPMMVEFKQDEQDGGCKLMEINGRFWGSLPLPQRAGVDFVGGYFALATGGSVEPSLTAPLTRLRTRHFLGDCKWLWAVLFKRDVLRSQLYPSRFKALLNFKLEIFRSRGDIFRFSDPLPSLFEVIDVLKR